MTQGVISLQILALLTGLMSSFEILNNKFKRDKVAIIMIPDSINIYSTVKTPISFIKDNRLLSAILNVSAYGSKAYKSKQIIQHYSNN